MSNQEEFMATKQKSHKGKMYTTKDYSIFNFRTDNRDRNRNHIDQVKRSLLKYNDLHLHPVIVNSDMDIVDGQHRAEAARELGYKLYYVVDDDFVPEKLTLYNRVQKRMVTADYLNYYRQHKHDHYVKFHNFIERTGLPLNICLVWINRRSGTGYNNMRTGEFKFNPPENIWEVMGYVQRFIDWLRDRQIKPKTIIHQRPLHCALKIFFNSEDVLIEDFFKRLQTTPKTISYTNSQDNYIEQLVDIYNYRLHKPNQLKIEKSNYHTKVLGV